MTRHALISMMLSCLLLGSAGAGRSVLHEEDDATLEMQLKKLNKPYVKSFKDNYGVVFDCVDMYKQPAFDHPLLKNHTLQIRPSSENTWTGPSTSGEAIRVDPQESCPDGTVLIRRTLKQDLVKAASVSLPRFRPEKDSTVIPGQHFAQLLIDSVAGSKFQAAGAVLEVDTVPVSAGQVSTAQILLVDDSFHSSIVSVVQAGWSVDTILSDSQTRFMTSWTTDDHRSTGCLNLLCAGFVVLSQTSTPGMVLRAGTAAAISISKDGASGNWHVFLNQENVGYFPKEIINNMEGATQVQMGGITFAQGGQKSPPMGSGVAPAAGSTTLASKFTQAGVQGANIAKNWVTKDIVNPAIYNIVMTSYLGPEGNAFQYGGPGGA